MNTIACRTMEIEIMRGNISAGCIFNSQPKYLLNNVRPLNQDVARGTHSLFVSKSQ